MRPRQLYGEGPEWDKGEEAAELMAVADFCGFKVLAFSTKKGMTASLLPKPTHLRIPPSVPLTPLPT